ncbi:MAG: hypothetical protein ACKVOU_14090 [Cytophagales bacterium]
MIYLPKSQSEPPCLSVEKLKASGTYNCEGVLEALKNDFKNKCYICEDKEPHSINTEHFKPHKGNIDLKFDWNNLFFCCSHCNNNKLAKPIFDEILNCTSEKAIDTKIKYFINPFPKEKALISPIEDSIKVNNTVTLLNEVYNGTTVLKSIESANIRSKLLSEIRKFQDLLFEYYDDNYNEEEKIDLKNQIIRQLRPSSSFTAFKRWIVRDNESLSAEFSSFM